MYKNNKVGVVVTAYNEELLLRRTIEELPAFVDRIIVVDDCSTDNTPEILSELSKSNPKIILSIILKTAVSGELSVVDMSGAAIMISTLR